MLVVQLPFASRIEDGHILYCRYMLHAWALKGFLYPYFGAYMCTLFAVSGHKQAPFLGSNSPK